MSDFFTSQNIVYIGVIGGVVLLGGIAVTCFCCRRRKTRSAYKHTPLLSTTDSDVESALGGSPPQSPQVDSSRRQSYSEADIVPPNAIRTSRSGSPQMRFAAEPESRNRPRRVLRRPRSAGNTLSSSPALTSQRHSIAVTRAAPIRDTVATDSIYLPVAVNSTTLQIPRVPSPPPYSFVEISLGRTVGRDMDRAMAQRADGDTATILPDYTSRVPTPTNEATFFLPEPRTRLRTLR